MSPQQLTNKTPHQPQPPRKDNTLINEKIKFPVLEVIDETGQHLGALKRVEALKLAQEKDLDLVVIAIQDKKVIAKILDYGKFKFEQKRKQKENKKKQQVVNVKEIKVKPLIGDHDLKVRAENAKKWLANGDKVKFIIEARGRMSVKYEYIQLVYDKFIALLGDNIKVVQANKQFNNFRYESIIERK